MVKKISAIILVITVILGISACRIQKQETNSIEYNLKKINNGIEQFSKLKNGTLEVEGSIKSANNAVESMNSGNTKK